MKIVSAQTMRELDTLTIKAGVSGRELMFRAGVGAAKEIISYIEQFIHKAHAKRFVVLSGKGNNGGDGYVAADYLAKYAGIPVIIYSVCKKEELSGDAGYYAGKLSDKVKVIFKDLISEGDFCTGDIIIDSLLGTGFSERLKHPYKDWVEAVNSLRYPVISIDIPSGLDGTTGDVIDKAVVADLTITIGLPKSGLFIKDGPKHVGLLRIVDIGIPEGFIAAADSDFKMFCENDARSLLGRVPNDSHKKSIGTVLVIGGSKFYKGAPILSGMAALRAGAGLVTAAVPKTCIPFSLPYNALIVREVGNNNDFFDSSSKEELSKMIETHDAVTIGPGIGTNHSTAEIVKFVLNHDKKIIIDADALNLISFTPDILRENGNFIFTPHMGELMRLLNAFNESIGAEEDRIAKIKKATELLGGTVVLKGSKTIVSSFGKPLSFNCTGSQALATAGTGDVLSGMIGAFAASGLSSFDAGCLAVYLHGLSGELIQQKKGVRGAIADDIIEVIPEALRVISPFA